jgi:hypothetical protein
MDGQVNIQFFGNTDDEPTREDMAEAIGKVVMDTMEHGPAMRPSDVARIYTYNPIHHLTSFHGYVEGQTCSCGGADGYVITGMSNAEYDKTHIALSSYEHHGVDPSIVFFRLDEAKAFVNTLLAAIAATETAHKRKEGVH